MSAIAACDAYHIYPDPGSTALRAAIASFLAVPGVGAEHLCCGCGSDELLDLLVRLIAPPAIVNLPPTFGMYPFLAKLAGVPVIAADRGPAPDFRIDTAAVAAAVAAGARLVFSASPNNPTGGMLSHAEVRALCALPALVVIDEAYAEFSPRARSAAALVPELGNLVVLRTFSKWAGLAGLRVGYSVSHAAVAGALAATKQPYNVNVAADVAARAALHAAREIEARQVAPMLEQRARMVAALDATGWLVPVPSDANFVLFEVRPPIPAAALHAALRRRGVLTRYYPSGRLRNYIRISTGRPVDIDRLLAALDAARAELEGEHGTVVLNKRTDAALFDMDGVLVGVAGSYREAIIRTARAFDAEVTQAHIDDAKAAGGANNDWALALSLIRRLSTSERGRAAALDEVTAEFERLYHGDAAAGLRGLKETETALVSADYLRDIKSRCPGGIAVVTGRPRAGARGMGGGGGAAGRVSAAWRLVCP